MTTWGMTIRGLRAPVLLGAGLALAIGCGAADGDLPDLPRGDRVDPTELSVAHSACWSAIADAPARMMDGAGLAGARGGAHLKLLGGGEQEVLLPLPQMTDGQVPVAYTLAAEPPKAVTGVRVVQRDPLNTAARIRLRGDANDEIEIMWTSIVLFTDGGQPAAAAAADAYLESAPCAQADAKAIQDLSRDLWPESGGTAPGFAAAMQGFVSKMEQKEQPRSLDAEGILRSGSNWICTANANLGVALMRAREIPARSLAVIPTTSQRLEMHRIVEFVQDDQWVPFDPSSLQKEIPLDPWQHVVMATTSASDEEVSMKPRMGVMLGCPYGHELEFLTIGVRFWGPDFFWTEARPIAGFDASETTLEAARGNWRRFLETGTPPPRSPQVAAAEDDASLLRALSETP